MSLKLLLCVSLLRLYARTLCQPHPPTGYRRRCTAPQATCVLTYLEIVNTRDS